MKQNKNPKRKWNILFSSILLIAGWVILSSQPLAAQPPNSFEGKTTLKASSLIGPELLKSDLYTVDEAVMNDGLLNHYTVRSKFGEFTADSTLGLKQLLHEIQAIAAMKRVETKNTAAESVVQSGKNTIDAVGNLITDPQKTLEGAAAGVSSLFSRASQVVGKRQTTEAEDSRVEQIIGKSKSKGEIATKYGVSVYSLNPVLQEELERLAWADYLGGIGLAAAQSAVPGAGGLLLTTSGTARLLNEVINNTPASELWVRNKNKLEAMKIDPDTVQLYLNNPSFSPALFTIMVQSMEEMKGVANRSLFVKISLQAHTHEMADAITKMTTMLAGYHTNVEPLQSVAPFGRFLYGKTAKGGAVVAFPADHVLWSSRVADAATWLIEPVKGQVKPAGMQLWILGDFSKKAQAELQTLGWKLHPDAQSKLLPIKKEKTKSQ
ncbi:MAG: hypothetical protein A2X81_16595 [Desulfobacterales bacterium GWB2_56_26]|nr:MAG: hypothetical protein A2X81_16595 [Desulfobacterales bacterium GWB2_56_26]